MSKKSETKVIKETNYCKIYKDDENQSEKYFKQAKLNK
jgi:ubiquitin